MLPRSASPTTIRATSDGTATSTWRHEKWLGNQGHRDRRDARNSFSTGMCWGPSGARMWMEESIGTKVNDERARRHSTGAAQSLLRVRSATSCSTSEQAAGADEDEVKVADLAIHLLDAIEAGGSDGSSDSPLSEFRLTARITTGAANIGNQVVSAFPALIGVRPNITHSPIGSWPWANHFTRPN